MNNFIGKQVGPTSSNGEYVYFPTQLFSLAEVGVGWGGDDSSVNDSSVNLHHLSFLKELDFFFSFNPLRWAWDQLAPPQRQAR